MRHRRCLSPIGDRQRFLLRRTKRVARLVPTRICRVAGSQRRGQEKEDASNQYKRCQDGIARFKAGDMMPPPPEPHPPNRCPPWPVAETGGWPLSFHPGVIFGPGNWPSSPSSPPHFAAFLAAAAASTNVFNSGFGLPSYPVARIQVSMSCNFG